MLFDIKFLKMKVKKIQLFDWMVVPSFTSRRALQSALDSHANICIHIFVESALISCSVLNSYIKRFHLLPTLFSLFFFSFAYHVTKHCND